MLTDSICVLTTDLREKKNKKKNVRSIVSTGISAHYIKPGL